MLHIKDIIIIIVTALYALLYILYPDFPLTEEVFSALVLWLMGRIGVLSYKHRNGKE